MLRLGVRTFCRASVGQSSPAVSPGMLNACLSVHPEVEEALATGKPVVALETAIVTHGMPYPTNITTAKAVEDSVRRGGSIPATIGIVDGRVRVGLSMDDVERLGSPLNSNTVKVSRRDIGAALALKKDGGTTCSATLIFAALCGIKFFATGGLGGVHRGGEHSMDISADLPELSRNAVGLVSAGVKSILDIGRTLEYLETLGVPVVSYGTDEFPAFYSRKSGFKSPWSVHSPAQAAEIMFVQRSLGLQNGTLFALPIPKEYEKTGERIQEFVQEAITKAEQNGMNKRGKDVTPWLLGEVNRLSRGDSIINNIALIENTAFVAGRIASAYAGLIQESPNPDTKSVRPMVFNGVGVNNRHESYKDSRSAPVQAVGSSATKLFIVGSAAVDVTSRSSSNHRDTPKFNSQSTTPGLVSISLGGVARNVAEATHRMLSQYPDYQNAISLKSSVGNDLFGKLLIDETTRMGMCVDEIKSDEENRTAVCNMFLDQSGELISGVSDMDIVENISGKITALAIETHKPEIVFVDANLSAVALSAIIHYCNKNDIMTFFEPTSVAKSTRIVPAMVDSSRTDRSPITFASPNLLELAELHSAIFKANLDKTRPFVPKAFSLDLNDSIIDAIAHPEVSTASSDCGTLELFVKDGFARMAVNLLPFIQHLIVKCGDRGVFVAIRVPRGSLPFWTKSHSEPRRSLVVVHGESEVVVLKHYPAKTLPLGCFTNVTGAGDTFAGAILANLMLDQHSLSNLDSMDRTIDYSQHAAVKTLQYDGAVSPLVSPL